MVERGADRLRILPLDHGAHRRGFEEGRRGGGLCRPTGRRFRSAPKACIRTTAFVVAGRIMYEYEQGGWNEWHVVFNDGTSGWLSDAQLAIRHLLSGEAAGAAAPVERNDDWAEIPIGRHARTEVTYDHEGALSGRAGRIALPILGQTELCRSSICAPQDGEFATIDYSEDPPLLFTGEAVEFD